MQLWDRGGTGWKQTGGQTCGPHCFATAAPKPMTHMVVPGVWSTVMTCGSVGPSFPPGGAFAACTADSRNRRGPTGGSCAAVHRVPAPEGTPCVAWAQASCSPWRRWPSSSWSPPPQCSAAACPLPPVPWCAPAGTATARTCIPFHRWLGCGMTAACLSHVWPCTDQQGGGPCARSTHPGAGGAQAEAADARQQVRLHRTSTSVSAPSRLGAVQGAC